MKKAAKIIPQVIELSFCYLDKKILCLCHIYQGQHGFFIGGWKRPNNILKLSSYMGY